MDIDADMRRRGEFPVDRPMDALRTDHQFVRKLFDRYFKAGDVAEKREVGPHILLLLEMHTALEETVFYQRVRDVDPALVARCEKEHEQAKPLIERLKIMDEGDPQTEQLFHQLAEAMLAHIENEERQLFPKVEQAHLDLHTIGQEMLASETRLIAGHAPRTRAPGMRP
ncbi:MAG TPA: hemerythrin domain-containing protein [Noviherbaspirillum sp.]|nr:hemerythrin domain-containing protein [Noviherbaspirillum sp.]